MFFSLIFYEYVYYNINYTNKLLNSRTPHEVHRTLYV